MPCWKRCCVPPEPDSWQEISIFSDMLDDICAPVTDGWSTVEVVLKESGEQLDLLRFLTRAVFPEDEDYFVRQIGRTFQCSKNFEFQIRLCF